MRGRPPKPTSLTLIEGRRSRRLNKQEPDPHHLEDLTPPEWLPEAARVVWREIAPKLRQARLLTTADVVMLAMGCQAVAQYRLATTMLAAAEAEPVHGGGSAQLNPWLIVQSMAFKQAMVVFQQFGMSPAARTRIAIQPQGDLFGGKPDEYFS